MHRSMGGYRIIEASAKEFVHGGYFKNVARHSRLGAVGVGVLRSCYLVERLIAINSSILPASTRQEAILISYETHSIVRVRFVLGTAPSHASIPQVKMARWPKADK